MPDVEAAANNRQWTEPANAFCSRFLNRPGQQQRFIDANLLQYCQSERVTFTRRRPYKKNDMTRQVCGLR